MPLLTSFGSAKGLGFGAVSSSGPQSIILEASASLANGDYHSGSNSFYYTNTVLDNGGGITLKKYSFDTQTTSTIGLFSLGTNAWVQAFAAGDNYLHIAYYIGTTYYYRRGIVSGSSVTWSSQTTLGSFWGVRTSNVAQNCTVASSGDRDLFCFMGATDDASSNTAVQVFTVSVNASNITTLDNGTYSSLDINATSPVNTEKNIPMYRYSSNGSRQLATNVTNRCHTFYRGFGTENIRSGFAQITMPWTVGSNTNIDNVTGTTAPVSVGEAGKEYYYNNESYMLVCGENQLAPTFTPKGHVIKFTYNTNSVSEVTSLSNDIYGDGTLIRNIGMVIDETDGRPVIFKHVRTGTTGNYTHTIYGKKWSGSGNTFGAEAKMAEVKTSRATNFVLTYNWDRNYFFVDGICYYWVYSSPYLMALDFSGLT